MKISMQSKFRIMEKRNGAFIPLSNEEAQAVSVGGYSFEINGDLIPFDWDCFYGTESEKIFCFATGRGLLWNDYEISDCYDEEYEEIGITRETLTAEFLASVESIEEFYVQYDSDFESENDFFIELLEVSFYDLETEKEYFVAQSVLDEFNQSERNNANV